MRIERDTVSPDSWTGSELHEAEWLRCRSFDDFPDVDTELVADDCHLVDEPDVHRAESVLEQLDDLSGFRARDGNHRVETSRIERSRNLRAGGRDSANDLRGVLGVPDRIAGIHALRTKCEKNVFADRESSRLELWLQKIARGPRISGTLEHDHYARPAVATHCVGCSDHVAHVGIARFGERRRNRDRHRVHLLHP